MTYHQLGTGKNILVGGKTTPINQGQTKQGKYYQQAGGAKTKSDGQVTQDKSCGGHTLAGDHPAAFLDFTLGDMTSDNGYNRTQKRQ